MRLRSPDGLRQAATSSAAVAATVSTGSSSEAALQYDAPTLLFILATNFLLYVALVLITYLVVKLYIQSAPENPLFEEATTYQRVPATHSGLELTSASVQARGRAGSCGSDRRYCDSGARAHAVLALGASGVSEAKIILLTCRAKASALVSIRVGCLGKEQGGDTDCLGQRSTIKLLKSVSMESNRMSTSTLVGPGAGTHRRKQRRQRTRLVNGAFWLGWRCSQGIAELAVPDGQLVGFRREGVWVSSSWTLKKCLPSRVSTVWFMVGSLGYLAFWLRVYRFSSGFLEGE